MDFYSRIPGGQGIQSGGQQGQQGDPAVQVSVITSMRLEGTDIKWSGSQQSSTPYSQVHQTAQKLQQQLIQAGQEQLQQQYHTFSGQQQQSQQQPSGRERQFAVAGGG